MKKTVRNYYNLAKCDFCFWKWKDRFLPGKHRFTKYLAVMDITQLCPSTNHEDTFLHRISIS